MKETMDSIAARADDCMGRGDWDGAERIFLAALTEAEEIFRAAYCSEVEISLLSLCLVYCINDISPNNLHKFPSAVLLSIAVARYGSFLRLAE